MRGTDCKLDPGLLLATRSERCIVRIMQNKRRFVRVQPEAAAPVEVQLIGTDFIDILQAEDISEGGVRIIVPHAFQGCTIDAEIDLIITLPAAKSFKASGRIKHIRADDTAFGVEFTDLPDHWRTELQSYVLQRLETMDAF
ncbi:MAG: PilZ domain-containing protein [Leptospiraceae bacterium]|nr:PilZ domain-containing protein [Leptospiraceae bacterium]